MNFNSPVAKPGGGCLICSTTLKEVPDASARIRSFVVQSLQH